jgi:hypothetical protein
MFSQEQYSQAQSLIEAHLRSLSDLASWQRDFVNAALANSTVFSRQMCSALNGTGVLFVEATEQIQGLFNRAPNKSLK